MPASTSTTAATTLPTTAVSTTSEPADQPTMEEVADAVENSLRTPDGMVPLADRMDQLAVPGVAVAVVRDGLVLGSLAFGVTPEGRAMTTDTVTQVGSVSKPVAAVGAVRMAADGDLPWDGDIATVLRSYPLPDGAQSTEHPVTVAALLSHTAGTSVDGFLGYGTAAEAPALPDLLAGQGNTPAVEVVQQPGTGFLYSGGGYQLVEQAMLDAGGAVDFTALMRDLVFAPTGMTDSRYSLELPPDLARRATSGSLDGVALPQRWQAHPEGAAAGLWTTADDLGRFLAAFGASLAGTSEALLPTEWARRMVSPVTDGGDGAQVAHGWFLDESGTEFSHNGRNIGYCAEIAGTLDGRHGVVVTNSFPGGTQLTREIIDTIAHAGGWR